MAAARRAALLLGAQSAALVLVIVIAVGAVLLASVSDSQTQARQRTLDDATHGLTSVSQAPAGVWLAISTNGVLRVSGSMPKGLPDRAAIAAAAAYQYPTQHTVTVSGTQYTIRTQRTGATTIQAVYDGRADRAALAALTRSMVIAGILALVLSGVGGAALARLALRPMQRSIHIQQAFISDASHELRTPLTLLSARAQLVQREFARGDRVTEQSRRDVDLILADATALDTVLTDLLEITNPTDRSPNSSVDLRAEVEAAMAAMRSRADARDIALALDTDGGRPVISGSSPSIHRAFIDVIDNALDFARTEVTVRIRATRRRVVISFHDDGPGFPGTAATGVSRPRLGPEGVGSVRHFGIGLALVNQIVETHGGQVTLRNDDGAVVRMEFRRGSGR